MPHLGVERAVPAQARLRQTIRVVARWYSHPDACAMSSVRGIARTEPDHDYVFADRLGQRYDTDMRSFDGAHARRLRAAIEPLKVVVTDVRA